MVQCKVCKNKVEPIFSKRILKKYDAIYFQCTHCDFVQTSEAIWLEEAYSNAITTLDIGLASRNVWLTREVANIIDTCFPKAKNMLDFAGGYGLFARLMRDAGYNFYRQDDYCENIFSNYFDQADSGISRFDLVTAFEVFEHFNKPTDEIKRVLSYSENLIFSTELMPSEDVENWWYLSIETGQHIAFYSLKTLEFIAKENNKNLYSNGRNLHIFSKEKLSDAKIQELFFPTLVKQSLLERLLARIQKIRSTQKPIVRESYLQADYKRIQEILNK